MNKIILTLFCFVSILSIATSININCSYQDCGFYAISSAYACRIQSTSTHENVQVSITGSHSNSFTNNDVIGLCGGLGNIKAFPKGLKNVFQNLRAFYVSGGIKEIHQSDMSPYPDLVVLILDNNKIEIVENGLFDYNPNLEAISFWANPIRHISPNVFDNLSKLRYYWMSGCADVYTENNRAKVLTEINRAKSLCKAYIEPTTTPTQAPIIIKQNCPEIPSGKESEKDFLTLNEKLDYLTTKVLDLDAKYNKITQSIENMIINIGNFESAIKHSIKEELRASNQA